MRSGTPFIMWLQSCALLVQPTIPGRPMNVRASAMWAEVNVQSTMEKKLPAPAAWRMRNGSVSHSSPELVFW